jgi:hypothetical protein
MLNIYHFNKLALKKSKLNSIKLIQNLLIKFKFKENFILFIVTIIILVSYVTRDIILLLVQLLETTN